MMIAGEPDEPDLHEGLDVDVEGVCAGAVRRLSGQLALLEQEGEQREERMSGGERVSDETRRIGSYLYIDLLSCSSLVGSSPAR